MEVFNVIEDSDSDSDADETTVMRNKMRRSSIGHTSAWAAIKKFSKPPAIHGEWQAMLDEVWRCSLTLSNPMLNALGSMLLKLRYAGPVSNFAFNFNKRHYNEEWSEYMREIKQQKVEMDDASVIRLDDGELHTAEEVEAGDYTRPLLSPT
jgi:hypothetical protein